MGIRGLKGEYWGVLWHSFMEYLPRRWFGPQPWLAVRCWYRAREGLGEGEVWII